jgi:hypothetical protein
MKIFFRNRKQEVALSHPKRIASRVGESKRIPKTQPIDAIAGPISSSSPAVKFFPQRAPPTPPITKQEIECDRLTNPTILSRLIANHHFKAADRRVAGSKYASEASIWICSKKEVIPGSDVLLIPSADGEEDGTSFSSITHMADSAESQHMLKQKNRHQRRMQRYQREGAPRTVTDGGTDSSHANQEGVYTFRQLPIHMACHALQHIPPEHPLRKDLSNLIGQLALTHPNGCSYPDGKGLWPLHVALKNCADINVIAALMVAAPDLGDQSELNTGVVLVDVVNHFYGPESPMREEIIQLVSRPREFWDVARQETMLRLQHRQVPLDDATIESTSVLADLYCSQGSKATWEDATIATRDSMALIQTVITAASVATAAPSTFHPVYAITWEDLEQRAVQFEKRWEECLEANFRMQKEIKELKKNNRALQRRCDFWTTTHFGECISRLEQEKRMLQDYIEKLVEDRCSSENASTPLHIEIPDYEKKSLKQENRRLRKLAHEWQNRSSEYEAKLNKLEDMCEGLSAIEAGSEVRTTQNSLTSYSSDKTPCPVSFQINKRQATPSLLDQHGTLQFADSMDDDQSKENRVPSHPMYINSANQSRVPPPEGEPSFHIHNVHQNDEAKHASADADDENDEDLSFILEQAAIMNEGQLSPLITKAWLSLSTSAIDILPSILEDDAPESEDDNSATSVVPDRKHLKKSKPINDSVNDEKQEIDEEDDDGNDESVWSELLRDTARMYNLNDLSEQCDLMLAGSSNRSLLLREGATALESMSSHDSISDLLVEAASLYAPSSAHQRTPKKKNSAEV